MARHYGEDELIDLTDAGRATLRELAAQRGTRFLTPPESGNFSNREGYTKDATTEEERAEEGQEEDTNV